MKAMHKNMYTNLIVVLTLLGSLITPALAQAEGMPAEEKKQLGDAQVNPVPAEKDIWTQIGVYGFLPSIEGDAHLNGVKADVDISFSDILDNLDIGGMGFVEHRRGRWSFRGDVNYLKVEDEGTRARNRDLSVSLDVEAEQLLLEGFVGYRLLTQELKDARLGVDLLGGARYNELKAELDDRAALFGLTKSGSREGHVDTVDGVVAVRVEYSHNSGWGLAGWADIGEGSGSSSYQFWGGVYYTLKNNIRIHGGYRFINLEYDGNSFEYDLNYKGPQIGLSFMF